jgi:hypothetical protein
VTCSGSWRRFWQRNLADTRTMILSGSRSSMSLIGIVRYLTEVEAYWLRVVLLDELDVPDYYCTPASQDGDFDDIDPATAAADVAAYQAEVVTTRANATAWIDLAVPVRALRKGQQVNLRWILTHLIEE